VLGDGVHPDPVVTKRLLERRPHLGVLLVTDPPIKEGVNGKEQVLGELLELARPPGGKPVLRRTDLAARVTTACSMIFRSLLLLFSSISNGQRIEGQTRWTDRTHPWRRPPKIRLRRRDDGCLSELDVSSLPLAINEAVAPVVSTELGTMLLFVPLDCHLSARSRGCRRPGGHEMPECHGPLARATGKDNLFQTSLGRMSSPRAAYRFPFSVSS
jgi:hypothetical protein